MRWTLLIESSKPLTVRLRSGQVHLMPGQPIEFSEEDGLKLLVKAKGRVRLVPAEDITIEPAAPNARPVYWERVTGEIVGPARPEFLAKVGRRASEQFWVIVDNQGQPAWIRSDRLRLKKAFEEQVMPKVFERMNELR
jgi:hypothetical protein